MSRETFERPDADPSLLEPLDDKVAHEAPPEFYRAEMEREYEELKGQLASLRVTIDETRQRGRTVPANFAERYQKLWQRHLKLRRQLGLSEQLDMFSAEGEVTSRAA